MTSSGQIVNERRRASGLTQESLADRIGVSRQTIAMWEIGKRLPTDSVAILTARSLEFDAAELLSILQHERLIFHVDRLQDQYGATIIIADTPNYGGLTMSELRHMAYQSQQGVHFAVTHIHKSIGFEYPEELQEAKGNKDAFDSALDRPTPGESLIIKMMTYSESETFIPNSKYVSYFEIVDDLGNHFWPSGMGMRTSAPSEASGGGTVQGYARFQYAPKAKSISLTQKIGNARRETCDLILFEDVGVNAQGISKKIDDIVVTYEGVRITTVGDSKEHQEITQIHIQHSERANPRYVGVCDVTDNLGNEYEVSGWSWNLEDKTREGFVIGELQSKAETISFKYLLAREVLDFELSDIPIPS